MDYGIFNNYSVTLDGLMREAQSISPVHSEVSNASEPEKPRKEVNARERNRTQRLLFLNLMEYNSENTKLTKFDLFTGNNEKPCANYTSPHLCENRNAADKLTRSSICTFCATSSGSKN
ncbi:PREDICTED: uncharacterized protein LOC108357589 [Rhagoletis zephyria]|uniref:uncharacterized protein LOC108357589 n=1 Tax=Rhagoletis zephyria TaxID=28612 RepID=UPI0008115CF0|nr:PREDICTED: uncharacterized protein LOC108357589 [Rhagoletis zephyria]